MHRLQPSARPGAGVAQASRRPPWRSWLPAPEAAPNGSGVRSVKSFSWFSKPDRASARSQDQVARSPVSGAVKYVGIAECLQAPPCQTGCWREPRGVWMFDPAARLLCSPAHAASGSGSASSRSGPCCGGHRRSHGVSQRMRHEEKIADQQTAPVSSDRCSSVIA